MQAVPRDNSQIGLISPKLSAMKPLTNLVRGFVDSAGMAVSNTTNYIPAMTRSLKRNKKLSTTTKLHTADSKQNKGAGRL
ncbi:hypothetical protein Q31a_18670 [Aureliella helgolandensis]|uniref:Uncharacterized protein n=1 Tax=Aureliella helgolandensis TaxID=2527968 RepID=A0A518G4P2_9BACT|nr:hypothetical protein Q31a_18670 [Aureliella helgolandensis]